MYTGDTALSYTSAHLCAILIFEALSIGIYSGLNFGLCMPPVVCLKYHFGHPEMDLIEVMLGGWEAVVQKWCFIKKMFIIRLTPPTYCCKDR